MKASRSLCALAALAIILTSGTAFAVDLDFYRNMLNRGVADANAGNQFKSSNELRVAAFGLIDELPSYMTAHVYLAVTSDRAGKKDDSLASLQKVVAAERITPTYSSLMLDPKIRSAFESLLATSLVPAQYAGLDAFGKLAQSSHGHPKEPSPVPRSTPMPPVPAPNQTSSVPVNPIPAPRATVPAPAPVPVAPRSTPQPQSAAIIPAPQPKPAQPAATATATTKPATATATTKQEPIEVLVAKANVFYSGGDDVHASEFAREALARDDTNSTAHQILGAIAVKQKNWNDAVVHYSVVRTVRRLSDDENAWFFVALVNSGRYADAAGVRALLPPRILTRADAAQAAQTLDAARPPKNTTPAPATTSTAPSKPSPQAIAAPQPVMPRATTATSTQPAKAQSPVQPTAQPAPQPAIQPQPQSQPATAAPMSRLVAASRHEPSDSPLAGDIPARIDEAQRLLTEGKILAARQVYLRLAQYPDMPRNLTLDVSRGLNQTSAWRESSATYQRVFPLQRGEELHMFYEAVNLYELGDKQAAKDLFRRASPYLPNSREVALYRQKIDK